MSGAERPPGSPRVVFSARGVGRRYPGVRALEGLDLDGYAGEVLAVCGANGAGKSTFARLLAGQEAPDDGEIRVEGHDGPVVGPADAERAGILLMHQEPLVVDDFSIAENVWLYRLRAGRDVLPWQLARRGDDQETRELLREVGLGDVDPAMPARHLAPGQRQMLALSRATVTPHRVLILDETTASTSEEHFKEIEEMVAAERAAGTAVVFVSHRMPEVFALSDRIAVLRNGELVDVLRTRDTDPGRITTLMIGEAVSALDRPPELPENAGPPALSVRGLHAGSAQDVSFEVGKGEVVGVYGLVGSGRSSVARSVSGQQRPVSGEVEIDGEPTALRSPGAALRRGVVYLTEDRRREGFVADFSNGENLTLSTLGRSSRLGVLRRRRERTRVAELIRRFQVKGGPDVLTSTLSGGNQQKVCLAKWLEADPAVVVLDEPTKGIDVGARLNIYRIIHDLCRENRAVLVVTSEAEEALMLCHRVLVLRDGQVAGEFDTATATTDDLIRTALGGEAA
ncbi:sugar ABC transporter ATP-binding protein [Saccharopolyspora oryzae]|uniref:Sugar ABC transporter ATP-binding protein n=1 Tax=Saccharopolyspora oryzae TaxID=2997343 RepID=A0ABT4V587_9PSEU|nr:sugar ABC transporter ATP-binding protein [Saccharopolyspora oryzae]MDA3628998.1 sugar ABC transporter ATP-binding protein [Saccharopolyspora oryzae]